MATKIGDLFFDVYADVSRAVKNVDNLSGAFKSAGGAAARAIGETIATATKVAVAGITALTTATLNAGVAYNVLGQSATAAFSTLYDDVAAANGILQQISQLDLDTPFRGSSLVRTARTLAGFGVEEAKVVQLTEALTEAIAGLGLGSPELQRVAIQFGQIQSRGRLAGDEARALANYGIDAFGILAKQLDLPVQKVRELSEEFKLTSDVAIPALIAGIESQFGGATEALFNTAAGQAEGLRSVFEAVGSAIVEPFIGFAGGGAIVTAMSIVREELNKLVSVAYDGSFVLTGFLAPLTPIVEKLAGATERAAVAFGAFLGGIDDGALTNIFSEFEGLGPLIAGAGAALFTMFAQSIPFLGAFLTGFNPIVVGIGVLIATSSKLRTEFIGAFGEISELVQPLVPQVRDLLVSFVALAEDAGPPIADILVSAVEALVPPISAVLAALQELLPILGPSFIATLEVLALALDLIVDLLNILGPDFVVVAGGVIALAHAFPLLVLSMQLATSTIGATGAAAVVANSAFLTLATTIGIALAALGSFRAISAGLSGDLDYLSEDVAFYEKPFQLAGRLGFALGGGDRAEVQRTADLNAATEAAKGFDVALLGQVDSFAEARAAALNYAEGIGLGIDGSNQFANEAALAWKAVIDAELDAANQARESRRAARREQEEYLDFLAGRAATSGVDPFQLVEEKEIDLLKELEKAAKAAWEEVSRLASAGSDATVDDFLRSLPALAEDLTDALAETPGVLRDLNISGVLNDVKKQAVSVVEELAREFGLSLKEVEALLDERGLSAVIQALGQVTETTFETVDPLVAKYSALGATADQLGDAVARLNDQRQTRIRAEIDQVEMALRDAKLAAEDARNAIADFLSGGYLDSPQSLADKLIGDIGKIGSEVEEALRTGGVRGEAAVRQAIGGLQSQLADIVNAGFEAGLNGGQIADLIAPVLTAINEEVGSASNRISSLDFDAGFTGGAGQALVNALQSGLDPAAIQGLISNILGADATVAGLESKLAGLQASLNTEVEFSQEQVQGALDQIRTETTVTAVITPEAAQLVFDEIQSIFNDDDLKAAVDKALITQEILDAAQAAEDQINLVFKSALSFDSAELQMIATMVSDEFYAAFNANLRELNDAKARENGFENYDQMRNALGPAVSAAIVGGTQLNQTINNDIKVIGVQSPIATASEVVGASSAAAGSGGQYDPSKYFTPSTGPR